MKKDEIRILDNLLHEYYENIRGEVFVSELEDAGFPVDDLDVEYKGSFLRPFRNDIMGGKGIEMHKNDYVYTLNLSRNGIYDVLPEGLTHKQEVLKENQKSVSQFTSLHKKSKKEEAEARLFFKPFENAFFDTRVELEKTEKDLMCLKRKHFFNFLSSFWHINAELPLSFQEQLLHILPFAHQIAGDFKLISLIIAKTLKLDVSYKLKYEQEQVEDDFNRLGNQVLGEDSIIGNTTAPSPVVIFTAGEVSPDNISEYINNGAKAKYIQELFKYLIPMEFEARVKWKTKKRNNTNQKVKNADYGYLAYTV